MAKRTFKIVAEELENFEENNENKIVQKKKVTNQNQQIKISEQVKRELAVLKLISKVNFDYEMIELLIDTYVENELGDVDKKRFKNLLDFEMVR